VSKAKVIFITGGSGGIGKSTSARDWADDLAGLTGSRVVLVDANLGQQSQREFHGLDMSRGLEEADVFDNPLSALITPRDLGHEANYALLPGPLDPRPDNMPRLLDLLGRTIGALSSHCDWIIVDLDKTDPVILADPSSVQHAVMTPWVDMGGARVVWKLESQVAKLGDGLKALEAWARPRSTGIVGVVPTGAPDPSDAQWERVVTPYGRFLGAEQWSVDSGRHVASGVVGHADNELTPTVRSVLSYMGCPQDRLPEPVKRGGRSWFRRRK